MTISHDLDLGAVARWADAGTPHALFWTVSGAHLYGFPSADSDIDVRGCFLAPTRSLLGLRRPAETAEQKGELGGREVESVAHEAGKYLRLLLRHNGYVLEQIFSPLVAAGGDFLARLRPLATRCVTRDCGRHYRGFLHTQRRLFEKQEPKTAKALLYAYRVALTGIHLLRTGEVVAHLPTLNEAFRLPYIPDLIRQKTAAEFGPLADIDAAFHRAELDRLEGELDRAHAESTLPEEGPFAAADEFLVELRQPAGGPRQ